MINRTYVEAGADRDCRWTCARSVHLRGCQAQFAGEPPSANTAQVLE
jgi:hypothetical protein